MAVIEGLKSNRSAYNGSANRLPVSIRQHGAGARAEDERGTSLKWGPRHFDFEPTGVLDPGNDKKKLIFFLIFKNLFF